MTPITRLEKWIAPRAVPLLAVISVLIICGGVAAYFIREHDLNRVEKLERVIRCQHSPSCRRFVERAIKEILRHAKQGPGGKLEVKRDDEAGGSLRFVPDEEGGITLAPAPPGSPSEPPKDDSEPKPAQNPKAPPAAAPPSPPATPSEGPRLTPRREQAPTPVLPKLEPTIPPAPKLPIPTIPEVIEEVEELPEELCTAIKELNGLCEIGAQLRR